ncbi:TVP38/TMEM64 family protein [Pseudalkalibacillus berkeleyi]|uniref:TVP38/TMEM64 family membrane protein n=1 Tax=Pseudalkalibacillus berkeleyi TaxID=1069813 RepID=A0ABS9GXC4_9BACL|nr:TVP38/TMEM64 family protein [Pseudalkalibacillus berkeleyi]MCF6137428.1 TVP38/TMEM64 family protein [Pseudalkalibacillus berkeleyi]
MKKFIIILTSVLILVFIILKSEDFINLLTSSNIDRVVRYVESWGILAPVISILLMVFQAIAAPIPAFLVTSTNGLLFGIFWGSVISWIGAMLGALVAFYLAKKLGYEFVKKKVKHTRTLNRIDQLNGKYGFWIVLLARLIPIVSFDLISFGAGLAGMKLRTFLISTGIGMLPATIAYTVLGNDVRNLETFNERMIVIVLILGLVTLLGYFFRKRYMNEKPGS